MVSSEAHERFDRISLLVDRVVADIQAERDPDPERLAAESQQDVALVRQIVAAVRFVCRFGSGGAPPGPLDVRSVANPRSAGTADPVDDA